MYVLRYINFCHSTHKKILSFKQVSKNNWRIPLTFRKLKPGFMQAIIFCTKLSSAHLLAHCFNLSSSTPGGEHFRSWQRIAHSQPCVQHSVWCETSLLGAQLTIAPACIATCGAKLRSWERIVQSLLRAAHSTVRNFAPGSGPHNRSCVRRSVRCETLLLGAHRTIAPVCRAPWGAKLRSWERIAQSLLGAHRTIAPGCSSHNRSCMQRSVRSYLKRTAHFRERERCAPLLQKSYLTQHYP